METENTESRWLGKYGMKRYRYLHDNKPITFNIMQAEGTLMKHLLEVDAEANRRVERYCDIINEKDPPPDKEKDQMGWVGHMNMTKLMAEERVYNELIYV